MIVVTKDIHSKKNIEIKKRIKLKNKVMHCTSRSQQLLSMLQRLTAGQDNATLLGTAASPFQATVASLSANYVHGKHTSTHTHILLLHLKHKKNK